eukprot:GEMP01037670.1.p1 GENE.GEMP01037670.1~~GEMP01037670.1.p1  ORF type:complete len:516 (+),score=58.43 GEMP01037670.1:135-1550(+)
MRPKSSRMGLKLSFQKDKDHTRSGKGCDFRSGKGGKDRRREFDTSRGDWQGKGGNKGGKGDFRDKGKGDFRDGDGKRDFRDGKGTEYTGWNAGRGTTNTYGWGKGSYNAGKKGGEWHRADRKGKGEESGNPFTSGSGTDGGSVGPTGPMLGKGSELRRVHTIHAKTNNGHWDTVDALAMFNDKLVSASSDKTAIIWKGNAGGPYGLSLVKDNQLKFRIGCNSLYFEPSAQMLFCGLNNGEIKCFQASPPREMLLVGHQKAVTCQTSQPTPNGEGVLITGSLDGTIRFWVFNQSASCFNCTHQLESHCGPVCSIQVLGECLWVGGERGMSCLNLLSLQLVGKIDCSSPMCGPFILFENYIIASFKDGSVGIYDQQGNEMYMQSAQGEHQSNTAVGLVKHPSGVPLILCGQRGGFVTAYELPSFKPRGSFKGVDGSDVTSILDLGLDGMCVVGGDYGDLTIWQWSNTSALPPS